MSLPSHSPSPFSSVIYQRSVGVVVQLSWTPAICVLVFALIRRLETLAAQSWMTMTLWLSTTDFYFLPISEFPKFQSLLCLLRHGCSEADPRATFPRCSINLLLFFIRNSGIWIIHSGAFWVQLFFLFHYDCDEISQNGIFTVKWKYYTFLRELISKWNFFDEKLRFRKNVETFQMR